MAEEEETARLAREGEPRRDAPGSRLSEFVQTAGGALIVALALVLMCIVALAALYGASGEQRVNVATGAFAAIGTLAGGYVGHRLGAHGKEQAERNLEESQLVVERVAESVGGSQVKEARNEVRQEVAERPPRR